MFQGFRPVKAVVLSRSRRQSIARPHPAGNSTVCRFFAVETRTCSQTPVISCRASRRLLWSSVGAGEEPLTNSKWFIRRFRSRSLLRSAKELSAPIRTHCGTGTEKRKP